MISRPKLILNGEYLAGMTEKIAVVLQIVLESGEKTLVIVVKGLDPLPGDEHGIDIRKVLTTMRMAVMEQPHWDVLETASIGIFSFSQFVMCLHGPPGTGKSQTITSLLG